LATLFSFFSTFPAASAQSTAKPSGKSAINDSAKVSDESSAAVKKKQAVDNVRSFAELISSFTDGHSKAQALAQLADMLWDYDQPYSRRLFADAIDGTTPDSETPASEAQTLMRVRSEIITRLAKRDAEMAKRLMDQAGSTTEADEANKSRSNFQIAYEAVKTQPDKSVEFARRSLQSGVPLSMSFLLVKLRERDAAAANELFLFTLKRLYAEPAVDADTLLALGTYIFTSPNVDPKLPPGTIRYVGVGNVLVADITSDQPNIPHGLIVEYLKTAADCLSRPLPIPEQRAKMYAAGFQLLRKAYKYAPELTSPIAAAMQWLSQDIPSDMTKDETYKNLEPTTKKDLNDLLRDIEKDPDSQYRDAQYLALIYDLWRQFDFAEAAKVNDKVSDVEAREKLSTIINFGRGARLLEKDGNALAEAENICAALSPSLERAVLKLGIASARARTRDSQRIVEALNDALVEVNKVDSVHRPYLLISIAGLSAQFAPTLAPSILSEAVRQFKSEQGTEFDLTWRQRVELGGLWREFPLRVKGINFDLNDSLRALVKLDPQGTVFSIMMLNNEELLAQMLPALASGMLH